MASKRIFDKSKIVIPEGTIEDFQRPNHADFMTSSEIAKAKFTGFRRNVLTQAAEVWLDGNLEISIGDAELVLNPKALNEALEKLFALDDVMPDHEAARQWTKGEK